MQHKDSLADNWDARVAQMRVESYNKEVRERHLRQHKKRQEKQELMRRIHADKRGSVGKDDSISHANVSDSSE